MKKLLLVFAILVCSLSYAQQVYVSTGLSFTNSDNFKETTYVSTELGIMVDNVAFGAVIGVNSLTESFNTIDSYWYEGKVAVYEPIGVVDGYVLLGVGSYVNSGDIFLEYGAGISKEFNNISVFIQVSNWDEVTYITPGVSFGL